MRYPDKESNIFLMNVLIFLGLFASFTYFAIGLTLLLMNIR